MDNLPPEHLMILIVDDDDVERMAVRRALSRAGVDCSIYEVTDGLAAQAIVEEQEFDCVFLDYHLPLENGLQVLQKVRAAGIQTPVIVLTGQGDAQVAVELMKAGASDYLPKDTLSPNALSRSLGNVIRLHRAEMEAMQAQAALREYAVELERRNQELDAFAGMVAHDLKNALTPVITGTQFLKSMAGTKLDDRSLQLLDRVIKSAKKGHIVIEALLRLANLRHQQPEIEPLKMDIIVTEALERVLHSSEERNRVTLIIPDDWPPASGYQPWVEEVWVNYIDNALKYGGSPPHVELGATGLADGYVRFWVRDNGPGLHPEWQSQLFQPFTRLDSGPEKPGYGLGLSIVQRIITRLGGEVGVESGPGDGSTFWFTLQSEPVD